jgi:hypothetical protein
VDPPDPDPHHCFKRFFFITAGLLLIGVGAYIQIEAKTYLDFLADNYLNTPIFIIIAGTLAITRAIGYRYLFVPDKV